MSRLPIPGGDNGNWGQILNDYLSVEHNPDGSLKVRTDGSLSEGIADGSITASKLSPSLNSMVANAQTAVQSVNGKSGQAVTLTASDVSAIATSAAGTANGVATLDGASKLTSAQLPDSVESKAAAAARALASRAKQNVVDLIDAPPMTNPPTLTWGATGGGLLANLINNGYSAMGTTAVHVQWNDDRIKGLGCGNKYGEFDIAQYALDGETNLYTCHTFPSTADVKGYRGGIAYYAFDIECSDFEFVLHNTNLQYFRVWVDGQPHSPSRVNLTPTGSGTPIHLLKVSNLPRGRARYTIMFEAEGALFGGILTRNTDSVYEPSGLGTGPAMVVLADSYGVAQGIEGKDAWPWKLACHLGIDRVYISATGGTGVNADNVLNGGTTGYKYLDRLTQRAADIPWDDVVLVVNQGSTNDGAYSVSTQGLRDDLAAECHALWDYERAQAPDALIVHTSTLRCKTPAANDITASGIYRTQAATRDDVLFVDQITEEWFTGTGYADTASPSQYLIQSDDSHPTKVGQDQIARRVAAGVGGVAQVPMHAPARRRNAGRLGLPGILTPQQNAGAISVPLMTLNRAYYSRFAIEETLPVTKIGFLLSIAASDDDTIQVGLFDRTGAVLTYAAATGKMNADVSGGAIAQTVALPYVLDPGAYYAGLVCTNVVGTAGGIVSFQPGMAAWWKMFGSTLPNPLVAQESSVTTFAGHTIAPTSLTSQYPFLLVRTD